MRILLSIHHELDWNTGAPGATLRLGQAYRELGHDVAFLSFDDLSGAPGTKRFRFPYFVARQVFHYRDFDVLDLSSGDGWFYARMRSLIPLDLRPLLVARSHGLEHIHHEAVLAEAKLSKKSLSWKYPLYNGGFRLWECAQSFAYADLSLFLNPIDQQYAVQKLHVRPERSACISNGIGEQFVERACTLHANSPVPPAPVRIAFIGNYTLTKGADILQDAMVPLMRRRAEVGLCYFGVGLEPRTVLDIYPADVRDRVTVIPRYANAELISLLSGFAILAAPSRSEGFGIATLEAMACGLVPIVSDLPGPTRYVVGGRNGLIVPVGDASALEAAIEKLIARPDLWGCLRTAAIASAIAYSWKAVAAETVALYEREAGRINKRAPQ